MDTFPERINPTEAAHKSWQLQDLINTRLSSKNGMESDSVKW
jgi:hypothetical protein